MLDGAVPIGVISSSSPRSVDLISVAMKVYFSQWIWIWIVHAEIAALLDPNGWWGFISYAAWQNVWEKQLKESRRRRLFLHKPISVSVLKALNLLNYLYLFNYWSISVAWESSYLKYAYSPFWNIMVFGGVRLLGLDFQAFLFFLYFFKAFFPFISVLILKLLLLCLTYLCSF